jgi:hypothetical protein
MFELLLPHQSPTESGLDQMVLAIARLPRLRSFGDLQIDFIDTVSEDLLRDTAMREYPELIALAYWMRKGHLMNLKKQFTTRHPQEILTKPRGLVLHFAPSNVDTIFVYSWFLSLLLGNANVVRLSSQRNPQTAILLAKLAEALQRPQFHPIEESSLVISYDHDLNLTTHLSAHCDVRVIWGGDETIRNIRQAPLKPTATEIVFADRFSLGLFKARSILENSESGWDRLLRSFYNDAFWFGQMACSSPRLILWIGSAEECKTAQQLFWTHLDAFLDSQTEAGWRRPNSGLLLGAYLFAAREEVASVEMRGGLPPARAQISRINADLRALHAGGGLFLEAGFDSAEEAVCDLSAKDQTVVHFGFAPEEIRALAEAIETGAVDRFVEVGQALQFSAIWDGYDLLQQFSRQVALR